MLRFLNIFNEIQKIWQEVPSVINFRNNTISFDTDHFSRYAIGAEKWQDITQDLKVVEEEKHYDRENRVKTIEVKVKNNIKENINSDLRLMVKNISEPRVEWLNHNGETTEGVLYLDIGQPYKECIFQGTEEDIPEEVSKSDRKKLLKDKPLEQKDCEKIIKKYPQIEDMDMIDWVLGPKRFSESVELEFSLPIKEVKTKKIKGKQETDIYVPEFKNFKFDIEVLNKIVGW